jgi:uncharacterized protein YqhQ
MHGLPASFAMCLSVTLATGSGSCLKSFAVTRLCDFDSSRSADEEEAEEDEEELEDESSLPVFFAFSAAANSCFNFAIFMSCLEAIFLAANFDSSFFSFSASSACCFLIS